MPKRPCTDRAKWRLLRGKPAQPLPAHYQLDCDYGTPVLTIYREGEGDTPTYLCEAHAAAERQAATAAQSGRRSVRDAASDSQGAIRLVEADFATDAMEQRNSRTAGGGGSEQHQDIATPADAAPAASTTAPVTPTPAKIASTCTPAATAPASPTAPTTAERVPAMTDPAASTPTNAEPAPKAFAPKPKVLAAKPAAPKPKPAPHTAAPKTIPAAPKANLPTPPQTVANVPEKVPSPGAAAPPAAKVSTPQAIVNPAAKVSTPDPVTRSAAKVPPPKANSSSKASARDLAYGNPAKALVDETIWNLLPGDYEAYRTALREGKPVAEAAQAAGGQLAVIYRKIDEYAARMDALLSASNAAIDVDRAIHAILESEMLKIIADDAMSDAQKDAALARLGEFEEWTNVSLKPSAIPRNAHQLALAIAGRANWGAAGESIPNELKSAYRAVYSSLRDAIHAALPDARDPADRLANLHAAKSDLEAAHAESPAEWPAGNQLPLAAAPHAADLV